MGASVAFAQAGTTKAEDGVRTKLKEEPGDIARFRERVQAALESTGNDKAYWGLIVKDADSGEVFYTLNAGRYFMPASNAKLFTTAMALATLGLWQAL